MNNVKKIAFILVICLLTAFNSLSQGVSFSYLIPANGYVSAPISPFSIRGIGIGGTVGLESGFTLYSIPGLPVSGLPFQYEKPLTGPLWSVLIPLELTLSFKSGPLGVKLLGGGFGIWNAFTRQNKGNMDRALAEYEGWDVATSQLSMDLNLGYGWMTGIELEYAVSRKFSLTAEAQYLSGQSDTSFKGTYAGGNIGETIETENADFSDARTLLQGMEFSLGVKLSGK